MANALDTAFRQTDYNVALDARWLTLHIGADCPPALARWLEARHSRTPAWLITARNPGATALTSVQNEARDAMLRYWAVTHGCDWLDSVNRDPNGGWPDEPGLLLAGLEEGLARSLAARFGQLAMVAVSAHAPVTLIWLDAQRSE